MALYQDPQLAILQAMGTENHVSLIPGQYTFGTPAPLDPVEGTANTTVEVTAIVPNSPYEGAVTVKYHRLDLADLETLIPIQLQATGLVTTLDVALKLNEKYGFNFSAADIVVSTLALTDGEGDAVLVAQDGSYGWIGTGTISITKGDLDITSFVTVTSLPGLPYPVLDTTKPYAYFYSYYRDFTPQEVALAAVSAGTGDLTALKAILIAITGDGWVDNAIGRWSLLGAAVNSNGPIAGNPLYNDSYLNVCVVTLDATNSQGLTGQLILHYGINTDF